MGKDGEKRRVCVPRCVVRERKRVDGNKRTSAGGWESRGVFLLHHTTAGGPWPPLASTMLGHSKAALKTKAIFSSFCGLAGARWGGKKGTKIQMPMSVWGVAWRCGDVVLGWDAKLLVENREMGAFSRANGICFLWAVTSKMVASYPGPKSLFFFFFCSLLFC